MTEKQKSVFESFKVIRARDFDSSALHAMTGPVIGKKENRGIIEHFTSEQYLQEDSDGHLASFVIAAPSGLPLAFFSLRCGELFESVDPRKLDLAKELYGKLVAYMDNPSLDLNQQIELLEPVYERMKKEGWSIDDLMDLAVKVAGKKEDAMMEAEENVTRVNDVHPSIEIKFLGVNADANWYWKSLNLPEDKKMGETLFWTKVVDTIRQAMGTIGCKYVYLFAADVEAEGALVQYYRVRLNFGSSLTMSANKPRFDYSCQFLFQSVKDLFDKQQYFLENYNS